MVARPTGLGLDAGFAFVFPAAPLDGDDDLPADSVLDADFPFAFVPPALRALVDGLAAFDLDVNFRFGFLIVSLTGAEFFIPIR